MTTHVLCVSCFTLNRLRLSICCCCRCRCGGGGCCYLYTWSVCCIYDLPTTIKPKTTRNVAYRWKVHVECLLYVSCMHHWETHPFYPSAAGSSSRSSFLLFFVWPSPAGRCSVPSVWTATCYNESFSQIPSIESCIGLGSNQKWVSWIRGVSEFTTWSW